MPEVATQSGFSFDASELFRPSSVASASPGEIVLRVPEGITPVSLRQSDIGKQLIHQDEDWYDKYRWANEPIAPGVYHLRLPIPDSNGKTFDEQNALLLDGEEVAPLVLVELALLCLKRAGLPDPLQNGLVRSPETAADGGRVGLDWGDGGRLSVNVYWDDRRYVGVWLASARRAS
jgi:hypothetical protein